MPREIEKQLLEIGGKSTDFGRETFLKKAAKIRKRIMDAEPNYKDITEVLNNSDFHGTSSKPFDIRAVKSKRKGNKMPKAITSISNVATVAGKRGRKAEFNSADFVMDIGLDNALDVTEEMVSGIEKLDDPFDAELLFSNDNSDANKYRSNRFGALKRAAIAANGEDTKYTLNHAENEDSERIWVLVRTA
jgi:hypothetical protein